MTGRLPDADDIDRDWAPRPETRVALQEFVQRLILLSLTPQRVDVRTGEGVGSPGWDCVLEVIEGKAPFVPDGRSYWEMGAGADPADKAQRDWRSRSERPLSERREATFIFVTPHRWSDKESWVNRKKGERKFGDVRVLDAQDLYNWAVQCAPAHQWLAEKIFGQQDDIETLTHWWRRWSRNPPGIIVSSELPRVSREAEAAHVREWAASSAEYHSIRSTAGADEVIAFIYAALEDDAQAAYKLDRTLIVSKNAAWNRLIVQDKVSLLLIPTFAGADSQGALDYQHSVIDPLQRSWRGRVEVDLPRRDPSALQAGLEADGITTADARRYAREARDDLAVLKLRLAGAAPEAPWWARGAVARVLTPVLFVAGWDQTMAGDVDVVSRLAGLDYASLERELSGVAAQDAPLKRRGEVWRIQGPAEMWVHLRRYATSDNWNAFRAIAVEVLAAPDPAWELPPGERWLAVIKNKRRPHSGWLRHGIAQTLAIVASESGFDSLPGDTSGSILAARVVREILEHANTDPSGGGWAAVADQLGLLAEAAPDAFLEALHVGTTGETPVVRPLFDEQPGFIFSQSNHPHLLWALERLAWSPEHLSAVTIILARLAAIDPGGKSEPRPLTSLRDIFFLIRPQTAAPLAYRLQALDLIRRTEPAIAWPLLLSLVPSQLQILAGTQRPEWRAWSLGAEQEVSHTDKIDALAQIIGWLLADADNEASRWAELVDVVANDLLPQANREPVLAALEALDPSAFDDESLEKLATALREVVGQHTAFPDAQWRMDQEWLSRLEVIASRLDPRDSVIRHRWLFEDWPLTQRIRAENYEQRQNRVDDERKEAVEEVFASRGWEGIIALVRAAPSPFQVGRAVALSSATGTEDEALGWGKGDSEPLLRAFEGYASVRSWNDGWPWTEVVAQAHAATWHASVLARFLLVSREDKPAWELAKQLGPEVEREYWERFRHYPHGDETWEAVVKLLEFGRPWIAVELSGHLVHQEDVTVQPELIYLTLAAAAQAADRESSAGIGSLQWDVAQLFRALDESGFDGDRLAALEWQFLVLLEHSEYSPKHLLKHFVTDPDLFVEVLKMAFRSEKEGEARRAGAELPEPSEAEIAKGQQAHRLLMTLNRSPGVDDQGRMDAAVLNAWVEKTRTLLLDADRVVIGEQRIGHALWYAPVGTDGIHPHEAVRQLFEDSASEHLELGFHVEAMNSRGAHFRRSDGGEAEREIAETFEDKARALAPSSPRMAHVLRGIAEDYRAQAKRWDLEATLLWDED